MTEALLVFCLLNMQVLATLPPVWQVLPRIHEAGRGEGEGYAEAWDEDPWFAFHV